MISAASLRLQQEVTDTYRLAMIGGYFYLAAWLVVAIYGNAFRHSPILACSLSAIFLCLAVLRRLHKPPQNNSSDAVLNRWLLWHWAIVFVTTSVFGLAYLWAVSDERFDAAQTAVMLSTMGLAVAIAHAFSMRLQFALICVAVMYLPGLLALWLSPDEAANALVMSIYLVYVVATLWRSHHEYQHRLDIDQQLRDQSDLFEQQGRIDALTDLANRRFFTESLMRMSQIAKTSGSDLVLMVLDLDHFKNINDQYGHAAGDACLSSFSTRLKMKFGNAGEHAARLGGEEFGVLLPGHTLLAAIRRAEEFRAMCESEPIQIGAVTVRITVSIGVAAFDPENHKDGDGLYRAADTAVYQAKHSGRNRVCSHEPEVA